MNSPGCSSVMCEVTFRAHEEAPDPETTTADIIERLDAAEIIDRTRVISTSVARADDAYIYYSLDFPRNIAVAREHLDRIGFDTCGRTGRMEYFNTDHCIDAAFRYVDRLLD